MIDVYKERLSFGSIIDPILIHAFCYRLAKAVVDRDGKARRFTYIMSKGYRLSPVDASLFGIKPSIIGKDVYELTSDKPGKTVFYIHGGAYWTQPTFFHFNFLRRLVNKAGGRVVLPVYPKAPTYTCRDVYPMVLQAYRRVCATYGSENVVLMGDSAGAGFVIAFALFLLSRNEYVPPVISISPWLDVTCGNPEIKMIRDPWLDPFSLAACGRYYAGKLSVRDPLISPIYGDVEALTRLHVFIGTCDVLFPDCKKLEKMNPNIHLHIYPKMDHVFPIYPFGKESFNAFDKITELTGAL